MRKKALLLFGLMLFCFPFYSVAKSADWIRYAENKYCEYYYEQGSLKSNAGDIKKIWVMQVYKGETVALSTTLKATSLKAHQEINCATRESRALHIIYYNEDRIVYGTKNVGEWSPIVPGSVNDVLHGKICIN